jgi:L-seryl-tRNA(Ser) seleniumtransferase
MSQQRLRQLPSVDDLLRREGLQDLIARLGRDVVRNRLRTTLAGLRLELRRNGIGDHADAAALSAEIEQRVANSFAASSRSMTRRVINATGVILHTNLGRAPLGPGAIDAIIDAAAGYCNLEYDFESGGRGNRGSALESMLVELLGCESAAVVNNGAAAVLLTLNTLADGGEVLVSRGELVEIGGSFRIPDVIAKSGARLREVGTTNRTRLADYASAITPETRVILRAHPSNYRIVGFTERPGLEELASLARERSLPLYEDLGSGCLVDFHDEPVVSKSIEAGASVVSFSGDKLLGGPQSGIILGTSRVIARLKSNPLMRALRVDKLTLGALEATIAAYASGRALSELPVMSMLHAPADEIAQRASKLMTRVSLQCRLPCRLLEGHSVVGGGSAPLVELPTVLIAVAGNASEFDLRLRTWEPPVVARILDGELVVDLRTVAASEEDDLVAALCSLS